MSCAVFTDEEIQVARERRVKYQGTAKVNIAQIQLSPPLPQNLDSSNLDRLRVIFRNHGCRRLEVNNFVPVIVSRRALERAITERNLSENALMSPEESPILHFEQGEIQALHGRHRLQVASEVLAPIERWWMVEIYLDGRA